MQTTTDTNKVLEVRHYELPGRIVKVVFKAVGVQIEDPKFGVWCESNYRVIKSRYPEVIKDMNADRTGTKLISGGSNPHYITL